jgi:hypothetical protein
MIYFKVDYEYIISQIVEIFEKCALKITKRGTITGE